MKTKQIIINSLWFGVIPRLTTIINVILLPVITPFLTTADYGIIGITNSYSGIVSIIAVMGLNVHLTNSLYVYKTNFRKVWGRLLAIFLFSGLFFSVIYGIVMYFLFQEIEGFKKILTIILACVPILFIANITLAKHYYPQIQKPKELVLRNLIASLCGLLVTFLFIYYLRLGYLGWLAGAATSALVCFLLFIPPLWFKEQIAPIFTISKKRLLSWFKISLPIVPHTLGFILLSGSNRIIMDFLNVNINDIGLYTNGYMMGDYAVILSTSVISAIAPRIQELYRSHDFKNLKNLYLFCQLVSITVSFILSIWMPQIYQLLIHNETLQPAQEIAIYICFANVAFPFYTFISTAAFIEEQTKKVLWLVFVPASLNIILNLIFIPLYGYKAAIYTTLISYWSQMMIPYFVKYFRDMSKKIYGNIQFPLLLVCGLIVIVISANLISTLSIFVKILISLLLGMYFVFYILKHRSF